MLLEFPAARRFCDGVSRRGFLQIGALAGGSLLWPQQLPGDVDARTPRSVISIYLAGGPSHLDLFDMKPEAPREIRGEFLPIPTSVQGMDVCELLPKLARGAPRFAIVRSLTGMRDEHTPTQSDSGWSQLDLKSQGGRPGVGPVLAKLLGPAQTTPEGTAPTAVDLTLWTSAGFLGPTYEAFSPDRNGPNNLKLNRIDAARFHERTELREQFDRMRRDLDASGRMDAVDSFADRAAGLITSGRIAEALNWKGESPETQAAYGIPQENENHRFLLARRLIEAGVRHVAFSWGGWDTHQNNFEAIRKQASPLDAGLSALLAELDERGRLQDTLVMMSGEFGRSPRVNGMAGRDHWPRAGFFFLAGGGLRTGQVIGATNRLGELPVERPVHLQQVFATVYRQLGVNAREVTLIDPAGRPQYLLEHSEPIVELV